MNLKEMETEVPQKDRIKDNSVVAEQATSLIRGTQKTVSRIPTVDFIKCCIRLLQAEAISISSGMLTTEIHRLLSNRQTVHSAINYEDVVCSL